MRYRVCVGVCNAQMSVDSWPRRRSSSFLAAWPGNRGAECYRADGIKWTANHLPRVQGVRNWYDVK